MVWGLRKRVNKKNCLLFAVILDFMEAICLQMALYLRTSMNISIFNPVKAFTAYIFVQMVSQLEQNALIHVLI